MKAPFQLHKRRTLDVVRGLLLISEQPADLLALYVRLGCDPLPVTFAVAGGFLLKLQEPQAHALPRTIRLRSLSPNLFLPADADLLPPLLDDEAAALVRNRGLVFLPGGRVLAYEPDKAVSPKDLLRVGTVRRGEWDGLPERPERAERLHEILLDRAEESPDLLLEAGGEDIGVEAPRPEDSSLPAKVRGQVSMGLGKIFLRLGKALGWKGLAGLGARLIRSAVDHAPRLSELILGSQEAALRALLREFKDGNLEKALRRALPLGREGDRGGSPAANANLPTHNIAYSLSNILTTGGGSSVWFGGGNVQVQLAAEYRKAAQDAAARGDFRRAAFIYGKLLRDFHLAAAVLSRGRLHHDAAILYLGKLADMVSAARAFEAAGEFDRALVLYRQRGEHLLAADLLRKTGAEDAAVEEYQKAAEKFVREQCDYLAAGELMLERACRLDRALEYFRQGWARGNRISQSCLLRLAHLYAAQESPTEFLALLDEADAYFAPHGNEFCAGQFYNVVAGLAEHPPLAGLRDDLRDRALITLTNKLRQRSTQEDKPGPQAAALFGHGHHWAPAMVNDAEFAFKVALKPQCQAPPQKSRAAPTHTYLGSGRITAVCTASETGQVFVGFENGRLLCFDPLTKTTLLFPVSATAIKEVTTNASGHLVVTLRRAGDVNNHCVSYRKGSSGAYEPAHDRITMSEKLTPIAGGPGSYFGMYSADEFEILTNEQLIPVAGIVPDLASRLNYGYDNLVFVDQTKHPADVEVLCFGSNGVQSCNTKDREIAYQTLGWSVQPPAFPFVLQASLIWFEEDGGHCEIARINEDGGGIYWSHLHRARGKWELRASCVASGHSGYQAVTILRPRTLAAAREGRIIFLRQHGNWLVPWSTRDLALPPPLACFFSPRTNELTVITKDNHAVCVPVPNG